MDTSRRAGDEGPKSEQHSEEKKYTMVDPGSRSSLALTMVKMSLDYGIKRMKCGDVEIEIDSRWLAPKSNGPVGQYLTEEQRNKRDKERTERLKYLSAG